MGRIRGYSQHPHVWRVFLVGALAAVLVLLAFAASSEAAPVRYFAVGNKQRIADGVSYDSFRNKMAALMDENFPNRSTYVQSGVDDVASHIRPNDPGAPENALAVFPEDVGLIATLIGSRGATAREQTSAAAAIGSLTATYQPVVDYYAARYPGQPPVRTLLMALTDTYYRSFYETFRDLAQQYDMYIAACINMAPARRVEEAEDPALVALLRDPDEPNRTYAYEAVPPPGMTAPPVYNTTLVFAPNGEVLVPDGQGGTLNSPSQTSGIILGSMNKSYLTPIEEPPPGGSASLELSFGPIRDQEVLDTPVGRLATVISKDAWMVDINDRFAAKHANVMLQPEAFSAWAYATSPWEPDIFKEGGFANLQKIPRFLHNINSSMTGNFYDVTFDGQSSIHNRKTKTDPGSLSGKNAWIGQNPDTGFLAVAPWIKPDPGIADPSLSLAARRSALAADGAKLLPGSGVPCADSLAVGACENGYREAIVWEDVTLPDGVADAPVDPVREPTRFVRSTRVSGSESTPVAQHAPQLAASGGRVYAVWHEARDGFENVYMAVSRNRGSSFGQPIRVSDNQAGSVVELNASVTTDGNQVLVAWQEYASGRSDDIGRVQLARFDTDGDKVGNSDVRVDDSDAGGKWLPQVALVDGKALVVWIDERDRGPEGEPLEHVYAARESPFDTSFLPAVRVDVGVPDPLALHLDNKWSPTIAVASGDQVHVAWTDFRTYNWEIFTARSDNGGLTFGPNVQINQLSDTQERVDERPTLAVDGRGMLHAAWTDLRSRDPDTNIFYARSEDRGASFSPNRQLDDSKAGFDVDTDTPTNQWHPSMAAAGDTLYVAWQDNRLGNNDIFFSSSQNGGDRFRPSERVDDTGAGVSEQTSPRIAWSRGYCFVVWEDNRSGASDIYLARRRCPA
jgi:hypothetical protein